MTAPWRIDRQSVEVEHIDQLDKPVDHDCEDDCAPCGRDDCGHLMCEHKDLEDDCTKHGCACGRWIADGTCGECDGTGEVTLENIMSGREADVPCWECGGSGTLPKLSAARWYR